MTPELVVNADPFEILPLYRYQPLPASDEKRQDWIKGGKDKAALTGARQGMSPFRVGAAAYCADP